MRDTVRFRRTDRAAVSLGIKQVVATKVTKVEVDIKAIRAVIKVDIRDVREVIREVTKGGIKVGRCLEGRAAIPTSTLRVQITCSITEDTPQSSLSLQ